MVNKHKYLVLVLLLIVITVINANLSIAVWYRGSLHQHTGFSTNDGYNGMDDGEHGDDCSRTLEGNPLRTFFGNPTHGFNVSTLKEKALDNALSWLAFTDHSYCLDFSEFIKVGFDCALAQQAGVFACLNGEELSVAEDVLDTEPFNCPFEPFGEAHIQAVGIGRYIPQSPFGKHCPKSPTSQGAIYLIKAFDGLAIIAHPVSKKGVEFLDFEGMDRIREEDGIEIWNEDFGGSTKDQDALNLWINNRLLRGIKNSWAFSATDAHEGVDKHPYQNVYLTSLNAQNLKKGLRSGRHIASDNGLLDLSIGNTVMGGTGFVNEGQQITIKIDYDVGKIRGDVL